MKNQTTHIKLNHFLRIFFLAHLPFEDTRQLYESIAQNTWSAIKKERYFIIKHCTNNACSHSSKLRSTRENSCLPLTPRHSSIYSSLVISSFPSLAIACCIYLPACLLCVQTAVEINNCRYCVVLLGGILNLLLLRVCCQIQESVSPAKIVPQFICC